MGIQVLRGNDAFHALNGTSYRSNINQTYKILLTTFGEPSIMDDEECIWVLKCSDDEILTIYKRFLPIYLYKSQYNWSLGGSFKDDANHRYYEIFYDIWLGNTSNEPLTGEEI